MKLIKKTFLALFATLLSVGSSNAYFYRVVQLARNPNIPGQVEEIVLYFDIHFPTYDAYLEFEEKQPTGCDLKEKEQVDYAVSGADAKNTRGIVENIKRGYQGKDRSFAKQLSKRSEDHLSLFHSKLIQKNVSTVNVEFRHSASYQSLKDFDFEIHRLGQICFDVDKYLPGFIENVRYHINDHKKAQKFYKKIKQKTTKNKIYKKIREAVTKVTSNTPHNSEIDTQKIAKEFLDKKKQKNMALVKLACATINIDIIAPWIDKKIIHEVCTTKKKKLRICAGGYHLEECLKVLKKMGFMIVHEEDNTKSKLPVDMENFMKQAYSKKLTYLEKFGQTASGRGMVKLIKNFQARTKQTTAKKPSNEPFILQFIEDYIKKFSRTK